MLLFVDNPRELFNELKNEPEKGKQAKAAGDGGSEKGRILVSGYYLYKLF